MGKLIPMDDDAFKRYRRVILVGEVTDKILDALLEQMRREKILDAFASAQEVSGRTQGTARKGELGATAERESPHAPPLSRQMGPQAVADFLPVEHKGRPTCDAGAHRSVGPAPIMPSAPDVPAKAPHGFDSGPGAAEVHTAPSPAAGNATLGRKSTGGMNGLRGTDSFHCRAKKNPRP